jgi:hypothetical protein
MKKLAALSILTLIAGVAFGAPAEGPAIFGKYVEARSCDVYTGPCFANGEVGLTGGEAILTWAVDRGTYQDVALDGLNVIAVVKASNTLGNPYQSVLPARAMIIVDERADARQHDALVCLAKQLGGELVADVVEVKSAAIRSSIGNCEESGCARVEADGLVTIATRCLNEGDHKCGNETTFYPPLTAIDHAQPAFTIVSSFSGLGLGMVWENVDRRSAFLGTFSL